MEWTRRDFLKLLGLLPVAASQAIEESAGFPEAGGSSPNILVLVFDALSARHMSLYGYRRDTTPHLAKFAERATVFHSHYAGGNFTTPGTASLLTGTYPWSHRAFHMQGTVTDDFTGRSIFALLGEEGYHRASFSHNSLAVSLLSQFRPDIDEFTSTRELCLIDDSLAERLFERDFTRAVHAEGVLTRRGDHPSSSLFLYWLYRFWLRLQGRSVTEEYGNRFPRGVPHIQDVFFVLEDAIDWTMERVLRMPRPFLAYYHFMPPHDPYTTRREFVDRFADGWTPMPKPPHPLSDRVPADVLNRYRREYDEYIAYVDAEFGRLHEFMERHRMLDDTYVIVTSDHGELFERGVWEHITPLLFESIIRVPLVIAVPGQEVRHDVYATTSCVDIAPTLLKIAGLDQPDWCEGEPLPAITGAESGGDRTVFAFEAKSSPKNAPLRKRTVSVIRGSHKLVHYLGYPEYDDVYELYDLREDPEELTNVYSPQSAVAAELREILTSTLRRVADAGG